MRNDINYSEYGMLGKLLDTCGHYFSHRVSGRRRGRTRILKIIAQRPGITQKELTEILGVQPASASELLMKLERTGYLQRAKNEQDRRSMCLTLTEEGQREAEKPEIQTDPFQVLTQEEQDQFAAILQKLIADWEVRYPHDRHKGNRKEDGRHDKHHHGHHKHHHVEDEQEEA